MTIKKLKEELNKYDENVTVLVRVDEQDTPITDIEMINSPEEEPYCKDDGYMEEHGLDKALLISGWDF